MQIMSATTARIALCLHLAFCLLNNTVNASAQQLIDRVLARVGTTAVTMTDVRIAIELGLVDASGQNQPSVALERTIDRQLQLNEVARFAPPEPAVAAVQEEMATLKMRAGTNLSALMTSTGLDEARLEQVARDTLRIRAYIAQRFGTTVQVSEDEARKYYEEHPAEFTRDGARVPFEQAESQARQRASSERLRATLEQWARDLRMRADVVIVGDTNQR
jgi:parvulin-like peptidyl-prolyl cis-trans isomerase-like protein